MEESCWTGRSGRSVHECSSMRVQRPATGCLRFGIVQCMSCMICSTSQWLSDVGYMLAAEPHAQAQYPLPGSCLAICLACAALIWPSAAALPYAVSVVVAICCWALHYRVATLPRALVGTLQAYSGRASGPSAVIIITKLQHLFVVLLEAYQETPTHLPSCGATTTGF